MNIRVLPRLETKAEWVRFCQREVPYCYVIEPQSLVDFQTTFLVITILKDEQHNGREAVKFSLGSRTSIEPAWKFVQKTRFSLQRMIASLYELEFAGNVRDNTLPVFGPDMSLRKFFARERSVIPPSRLGELAPLAKTPAQWSAQTVCRMLANGQYMDLRNEPQDNAQKRRHTGPQSSITGGLILTLLEQPARWQFAAERMRLYVLFDGHPRFSVVPRLPLNRYLAEHSPSSALFQPPAHTS